MHDITNTKKHSKINSTNNITKREEGTSSNMAYVRLCFMVSTTHCNLVQENQLDLAPTPFCALFHLSGLDAC